MSYPEAGDSAWDGFERTRSLAELDGAIAAFRAAVAAVPPGDPGRVPQLYRLLGATHDRFKETRDPADLDRAIAAGREAVSLARTNTHCLTALGALLLERFRLSEQRADLDASVDLARIAASLPPTHSADGNAVLANLGAALSARFTFLGSVEDLEESIELHRSAVALSRPGGSRKSSLLRLAQGLGRLAATTGRPEGLEEAVVLARRAVNARPREGIDQPHYLGALGRALTERCRFAHATEGLDEALGCSRAAFDSTPPEHPDREARLAQLVDTLALSAQLSGSAEQMDEAVRLARADGGSTRILVDVLALRYRGAGAVADLDEAVALSRADLARAADGRPDQADRAAELAQLLFLRHRQMGALADLDEAVLHLRAVLRTPAIDRRRRAAALNSLGVLLWARSQRRWDPEDGEEAIALGREAVATGVHRSDRAMHLSNLANALLARFERHDGPADLDEAVETARQAVAAAYFQNEDLARYQANLTHCLTLRFERTGRLEDLDEAVAAGRSSVALISGHHPERSRFLANLGAALQARHACTADPDDRSAAVAADIEASAVSAAPAWQRLGAARAAAAGLVAADDVLRATDLLVEAVRLLPEVSPRRLVRSDQEHALGGLAGLAGEAASLVLADPRLPEADRPRLALGLLETGRAVIISQALDGRDDLSELRRRQPDLASRFVELRDRLDRPWDPAPASGGGFHERHELAAEFAATQARIRELDGFASFGLPPGPEGLVAAAAAGPVVVLNVSAYGSHALLVTPDGVGALPLPELGEDGVAARAAEFLAARQSILMGSPAEEDRAGARMLAVLEWLWDTAAGPVLDALGPETARIWWVPCGLLSLLPVHAAGHHSTAAEEERPRTVIDRVVSSYTPSLRTLVHTRRSATAAPPDPAPRAMVVAMPTTPGLPGGARLPFVADEVGVLRGHLPELTVLAAPEAALGGSAEPTKNAVLARLADHPIAHFCCHGGADPVQPSRSLLLLQDHRQDPFTAAGLTPVALDRARLAYLSACNTAATRPVRLLDESIHLASAFHVAGFPHVVSTLWEIDDRLSVDVTDDFYAGLRTAEGTLDTDRAAHALHRAVRRVRDGGGGGIRNPFFWASYVHIGV